MWREGRHSGVDRNVGNHTVGRVTLRAAVTGRNGAIPKELMAWKVRLGMRGHVCEAHRSHRTKGSRLPMHSPIPCWLCAGRELDLRMQVSSAALLGAIPYSWFRVICGGFGFAVLCRGLSYVGCLDSDRVAAETRLSQPRVHSIGSAAGRRSSRGAERAGEAAGRAGRGLGRPSRGRRVGGRIRP